MRSISAAAVLCLLYFVGCVAWSVARGDESGAPREALPETAILAPSTTPKVGDLVTVRGVLHLRGNQPFQFLVLVAGDYEWELHGLDQVEMRAWQGGRAVVRGTVMSLAGDNPAQRARLEVYDMRRAEQ